ncbi:hypothetical protein ACM79J_31100 [Pseudomonas aeruginosa]|uniref:hypothetical protein n=1 Tax=Pseudomonas TaxID=286 RepID=UPI001CE45032|nr:MULTISPECIES: hypothetical protein [Pseudomonas]
MRERDVDAIGGFHIDPGLHLVSHVLAGADDGQVLLGYPCDALYSWRMLRPLRWVVSYYICAVLRKPDDLQLAPAPGRSSTHAVISL